MANTTADFNTLLKQSDASFENCKKLLDHIINFKSGRQVLQLPSSHTEIVLEKAILIVKKWEDQLLQNIYLLDEFFAAALELKCFDWAKFFLKIIDNTAPKSVKAFRALGLFYEAIGNTSQAQEIYNELFFNCQEDLQTFKRMIVMRRDYDVYDEALEIANSYLKLDMSDMEMWLFLTDLYLQKQNYSKAQYCFEEMLMIQPNNFRLNLRYAEILYSMGGLENLFSARKYFSYALVLNSKYLRASLGLIQTCKQIAALQKNEEEKNTEILLEAQKQVKKLYAEKSQVNVEKVALFN